MNKKTSFSAIVELPKSLGNDEATIDVELDKDEESLTYDEVEDAILEKVDAIYGLEYDIDSEDEDYPTIVSIVINADDGESYPVISESMDDTALKESKEYSKFLVLPNATYELTPEAKLWMTLKDSGIIDQDAPFDYAKYHKLVEVSK